MTDAPGAPEPLAAHHDATGFDCGVAPLNDWLTRRAASNQASGATRTFVAVASGRIVAYHALAAGAISIADAPGPFRRNMPDPVPVAIWARVAIHRDWQGRGLGRALARDAVERVEKAAEAIGIRGLIVHALSVEAKAFYVRLGFTPSASAPMTLVMTLNDLQKAYAVLRST